MRTSAKLNLKMFPDAPEKSNRVEQIIPAINGKEGDDMIRTSDRTAHAVAGAMSVLVLLSVSAGPVTGAVRNADASGSLGGGLMAQAAPPPVAPSGPAPQTRNKPTQPDRLVARVEARISRLHKQFQIAAGQEPQFQAFADVMRSNAQGMRALFQQRAQSTDLTAVTRLRWYQQITAAHAEALSKMIPVFETLYQSMSEKQKRLANAVFEGLQQRRPPRRAG
jgi:periplasmic protein CpxP/Spy